MDDVGLESWANIQPGNPQVRVFAVLELFETCRVLDSVITANIFSSALWTRRVRPVNAL